MIHSIDATDKSPGRLATQIVKILCGKTRPDYDPSKEGSDIVEVKNVDKMRITGKKLEQKIYYRHTGYPGGLKKETMQKVIEKKGMAEVLRRAVWGMLPKNKLRKKRMKRLKIE